MNRPRDSNVLEHAESHALGPFTTARASQQLVRFGKSSVVAWLISRLFSIKLRIDLGYGEYQPRIVEQISDRKIAPVAELVQSGSRNWRSR